MQIFRVKLDERQSDCGCEFYFTKLPTQKEVRLAAETEKALAPEEYEQFYDEVLLAIGAYDWPTTWSPTLSESGHAIDDDIYVRIKNCIVIENGG